MTANLRDTSPLTNDKQNKIVKVLSNDHFKSQDEFCGKDKSISLCARPNNGAYCTAGAGNIPELS